MSKLQGVRSRLEEFRKQRSFSETILDGPAKEAVVEDTTEDSENRHHRFQREAQNISTEVEVGVSRTNQHYDGPHQGAKSYWVITGLKSCLWLLLWGFSVEVGFGIVYIVLSGLVFMVLSLRGGKKRAPGVPSAYSVFNKNFEVIDGTFTAEQFERELRYGPSSVR